MKYRGYDVSKVEMEESFRMVHTSLSIIFQNSFKLMDRSGQVDMSSLPAIYSRRKTRKCSSCKCLKPMDQFLPIVINKKTVIPKTCQYCRSRRNNYYWSIV